LKRILLTGLCFLFFAALFRSDRLTGWVQQTIPRPDLAVLDLSFTDTLNEFFISSKYIPSDSGFIFRTSNGGQNWLVAFTGKVYLTSIHFVSNLTGYCAGRDTIPINGLIKKTTNGGINWFNCTGIYNAGILDDVYFPNKDTGWVCSRDLQYGGLWRTTNGGLSWQQQMNASYMPQRIFFVNSSTGWVIGNSGQYLYKTLSSGENWFINYDFNSNFINDVFFLNIDSGYIIGGGGGTGIMRTTNGGYNWHSCNNPTPYGTAKLFFINDDIGWAGSGLSKIIATKDGYNWGYQNTPGYNHYTVCFVDTLFGWAGYSGLVYTTNGGGPITYVGIKKNGNFIPSFELGQNYSNPFNASTRIKFSILKPCYLELSVMNITGKEIARLIDGRGYKEGEYDYYFDAGKYSLSSEVYFDMMRGKTTDNREIFVDAGKMVLTK
jgi:photosystem II stability/assembly factor-like uncharacterized protein